MFHRLGISPNNDPRTALRGRLQRNRRGHKLVAVDIETEDLELLARFVSKLGGYAEGLFDYYDFRFPKTVLRGHIDSVRADLLQLRQPIHEAAVSLRPPTIGKDVVWEEAEQNWNYGQTLRSAGGITMISQNYRDRMTPENLRRAMTAKVLHHCQAGLLDDLIDTGRYSFIEAKDLYHHCLTSLIDPGFEINAFRKELALSLNQEQLSVFDLMTNITAAFNQLYQASPHGNDLFYEMERINDRHVLGQALTMFQKHPNIDLPKLKRVAMGLSAMDSDLRWTERLSPYLSGVPYYNLIDMSFLDELPSRQEIDAMLHTWFYYDLVITMLNHIVGVHKDLRSGIVNLALLSVRESEVLNLTSPQGYNPSLTVRDYEDLFARTAEFSNRALRIAVAELEDEKLFYPFITIMIPVVLMADWIGNRDDMIHQYLATIAPSVREAAEAHAVAESRVSVSEVQTSR